MSYQKHHAPSQQIIKENEEYSEDLKVIRPLQGIESNKHQPIIKANKGIAISIDAHEETPINYIKHHYKNHQKILESIMPKTIAVPNVISQMTQTVPAQSTTQYPSSASGSSKYFSVKSTRKTPLVNSINVGQKKNK